jgi:protein TonB
VERSGPLPKPFNLASGPGKSLTFSETFLFNADYRFQLRTLAPVQ